MSDTGEPELEQPRCPNCGELAADEYDIGEGAGFREFDCRNPNCRCQVFRVEGVRD